MGLRVLALVAMPSAPRRMAGVLGALSAFGPLSMDMYLPGLPALGRELRLSEAEAQLTITGCLLGPGLGQLLTGPLSDSLGRRRLLLIAVFLFALTSLSCAAASSGAVLIGLRLAQGCAGGGGLVLARSIVRDLYSGAQAARYYSALMMVSGLAPILAPLAGGALLRVTTWHGVFAVLAMVGALLFAAVAYGIPETLPAGRRRAVSLGDVVTACRNLISDHVFLGYTVAVSLAFGGLAAYLAGSSFVLEGVYGASVQLYSVLFAANAAGILVASQLNRRLLLRLEPGLLLLAGLSALALGGVVVLAAVLAQVGLLGVMAGLFVSVSSLGLIAPNATALALTNHPDAAGTGSALIGIFQFGLGAAVAPLVGLAGQRTALPMALVIAGLGAAAVVLIGYLRSRTALSARSAA